MFFPTSPRPPRGIILKLFLLIFLFLLLIPCSPDQDPGVDYLIKKPGRLNRPGSAFENLFRIYSGDKTQIMIFVEQFHKSWISPAGRA
jgi:hypothetical protein